MQNPPPLGPPSLHVAGDMGLLVSFGDIYAPKINNAVLAFDRAFGETPRQGVIETVPTFRSLLIRFDPAELSFEALTDQCQTLLDRQDWYKAPAPKGKSWVLPTVYGGARGDDIGEVADLLGLREDQVIDAHASAVLRVAMLGFSPGLAYLGQLPEIWDIPRKTEITPAAPAGAILVAVRQTVLPCTEIPTGWRQIGQTPFRSFDLAGHPPFLLSPGDKLRFEPVPDSRFDQFLGQEALAEVTG